MLGRIAGAVRFKEPLSFHTSLRIGGPAEFFIVPQDLDDVRHAVAFAAQEDLPVVVIGGGNNLLVADRGLTGVVLKLQGMLSRAEFRGDEVVAGGGLGLSAFIREAAAHGLGGLEHLAGIPGTVGGVLATGAGAAEGTLADACAAVYVVYPDGTLGELRAEGLLRVPAGTIVAGARFTLARRPLARIQRDLWLRLKAKRAVQPFALAAVGYVWRNPAGELASRLIDRAGLRGKRLRGIEISAKCPNILVNRGNATAADVRAVMELVEERVEARTGVRLVPDLRQLGFDAAVAPVVAAPLALAGAR